MYTGSWFEAPIDQPGAAQAVSRVLASAVSPSLRSVSSSVLSLKLLGDIFSSYSEALVDFDEMRISQILLDYVVVERGGMHSRKVPDPPAL